MLNDLRKLFRKSWDSFHAELSRRDPEDEVAELLTLMRREMVAARAALPEHDEVVERTRADLAKEREALDACRRREGMAERIGDEETARIARDFAEKHEKRLGVLEQKLRAAEGERDLQRAETEEMLRRYKQADANRFGLVAELRRTRAQESVRGSGGAFDTFARMAESVEDGAAYADALEELSDAPGGTTSAADRQHEAERRLEELKRRMGRE